MKINFKYKKENTQVAIIEYLIKFLEQHPLKPTSIIFNKNAPEGDLINVYYGLPKTQTEDYYIPKQNLIFELAETATFITNKYRYDQTTIFSVENSSQPDTVFMVENNFQFDLLETLFFHISRYEEVFAAKSDLNQAGWLDEKKQFLIRNGLQQIPVVDHLVVAFFEAVSGVKIFQRTSYDISHDVDILYRLKPLTKTIRALAGSILYRRGLKNFWKIIHYAWIMRIKDLKDPYDNFDQLLRKENTWKSKQLFLMVGGNTKFDNKYSIDHPYVADIIQMAFDRGYKIGLHPSYNAGFEKNRYEEEIKQLSKKITHPVKLNRQHWLRFNWKITPYLWEENSIEIDSSMGYNQHLGFRCGTGFPYHMFDFKNNKAFSWKEQPLAFMESSALHFAKKNNKDLSKVMIDFFISNNHNTHININFHNSNFDPLLETGQAIANFYHNELIQIIEG